MNDQMLLTFKNRKAIRRQEMCFTFRKRKKEAYLSQHSAGAERAEKVCSSPTNLSCYPEQT